VVLFVVKGELTVIVVGRTVGGTVGRTVGEVVMVLEGESETVSKKSGVIRYLPLLTCSRDRRRRPVKCTAAGTTVDP